jgi:hypothetical protein
MVSESEREKTMEQEQKRVVTLQTPEFQSWLKGAQELLDKHQQSFKFPFKDHYFAEELGKFIRVWRRTETDEATDCRGSCMCFVAMQDNETKALGAVRAGDVLKPASWKAPTRHARGNIFDTSNGLASMNHNGPNYLK